MLSEEGVNLNFPLSPSPASPNPSHSASPSVLSLVKGRSTRLYQDIVDFQTLILVRDPPRERLAASRSHSIDNNLLTRVPDESKFGHHPAQYSPSTTPVALDARAVSKLELKTGIYHHYHDRQYIAKDLFIVTPEVNIQSTTNGKPQGVVKKRSSIQGILIPSFLQGPLSSTSSPPESPSALTPIMRGLSSTTSSPYASSSSSIVLNPPAHETDKHTRKRSLTFSFSSSRRSPPPAFLLDDDPFANLTAAPSVSLKGAVPQAPIDAPPTPQLPRSLLYDRPAGIATMPSSPKASIGTIQTLPLSTPASPFPRSISGGRIQARAAHQRPAFKSRPSLPSLSTLARMNVVLTKKVRKGRVGAGLPFEPWDDLPSDDDFTPPASTPPRQEVPSSSSSLGVATPSPTAFYADPTAIADATYSQTSAPQGLITPQPLLPSQIMALGSIAADVGMVVPVRRTPRRESASSSTSGYYSGKYFSPILQDSRVPGEGVTLEAEHPASSGSESSGYSEINGTLEDIGNPIEDEEVSDFLERYHQSSRNTSEDGHDTPSATIPTPATAMVVDVLPVLQETSFEKMDAEQVQPGAFDGQDVVSLAEEASISLNSASHQETKGNENNLEDVAFDERHSHMYPDHLPHDDSSFMHSGSMLFSSPPSSFTLSRSISSASHSSYASSDSVGQFEDAEDGDDELADSELIMQRRSYGYRHLMDPSLSSLELDAEADPEYTSRLDVSALEVPGTSRSSSGRPSLTRTRSSSNESDVPYSPLVDNYPFPHHGLRRQQHSGNFAPPELVSDTDGLEGSSTLSASNPVHESAIPSEEWRTTFGDYQSGMIGEGVVGFGFGFDKVALPVEVQEVGTATDSVENESLASGTSVNVTHFSNANSIVDNPETTADDALPSSLYSHPEASSSVQLVTPPPISPNDPVEGMFKRSFVSSRPVSAVKTSSVVEPTDATQSQSTGGGRAYMPTATSPRGNGTSGQLNSNSQRAGYSRRYDGQGRGNSDDEDGGDERRRRRALERGHSGETVVKELNLGESTEDESDRYISASSTRSTSHKTRLDRPRLERSPSRSPVNYTSPLPSGSSMKPYANFPRSSSSSRYVSEDSEDSDDDDVPLAKAIPGALKAQKTIRRQVREEREQRKREKANGMESDSRRARQTTLRPSGANGNGDLGASSSRDAATMAAASVVTLSRNQSQARQRTMTLPGKPILNPDDLARKLQNVQIPDQSPPPYSDFQNQYAQSPRNLTQPSSASPYSSTQQSPTYLKHSKSFSRPSGEHQHPVEKAYPTPSPTNFASTSPAQRSRSFRDPNYAQRHAPFISPTGESQPPFPTLRSQRSFHRPSGRNPSGADEPRDLAIPSEEEQRVGRTSVTSPRASQDAQSHRSLSLSRRSNDRGERAIPSEPVPALPTNLGRTSNDEHRRLVKPNPNLTRTSAEAERSAPRITTQPSPLPNAINRTVGVIQQRVFVGNLQQFHMVEIGPSTTAGDVVSLMDSQGTLSGWAGSGGWMVFEIAQDFGMERPIRSYELLADVQSSWLKDKTVNYFMLKLTPLVVPLSRSAIPSSSPTHSGYIEWEAKRGKWSKRWVQLKEHSLWISKRDNLKDQVLLCSLSNFDAYHVTRPHRAPKQFTFAVKSTDKLTFFENTDDYMHNFSCSEKDGKIWMEKILIARSYVLHQERHVLFGGKPNNGNGDGGAQLARSGTRKNTSVAHRPVQQPLVNLPPFQLQPLPHANVFEPGSLLSKQL